MRRVLIASLPLGGFFIATPALSQSSTPVVPLHGKDQLALVPATLGVIVNVSDPQSVDLGRKYAEVRGIPQSNIIQLQLPKANVVSRYLMARELNKLENLPNYGKLTGFVLAFDKPYRVDGNQSITSAFSQGLATMTWKGSCNLTHANPDAGASPGASLVAKPTMLLFSGGSLEKGVKLAQRGKSADGTDPDGEVFLVKTSDIARSKPREASMDIARERLNREININIVTSSNFANKSGILGFQTGLPVLNNLNTLTFLPGAFADHLTSTGGAILDNNPQTPITALIEAGATASFGTVREPCNFPGKFPDPLRLLANYVHGDTILEAYWKSLDMTTEGLLIGEPLSRPFPVAEAVLKGDVLTLRANRHTRFFLENAPTVHAVGVEDRLPDIVVLGIYDVRSGRPSPLGSVRISGHVVPGEEIGSINVKDVELTGLVLGISVN